MLTQLLDKVTLNSNQIIFRQNLCVHVNRLDEEKHVKIINGFLYTISKINSRHLLNRKIYVRISEDKFETCVDEKFHDNNIIPFDSLFIIDNTLYLTESEDDILIVNKLIRKEKLKEILKV
jgi:hypothetical protein